MDSEDRDRVIEILQRHYSPENVLLTAPTEIWIFRERTQQYETWEVVLWNLQTGEFLAWRRDKGLKARPIKPDRDGLVEGVSIAVPEARPRPATAPTSASAESLKPLPPLPRYGDGEEEVDDAVAEELAADYLKRIEGRLARARRGRIEHFGVTFNEALRDMERSQRERQDADRRQRMGDD